MKFFNKLEFFPLLMGFTLGMFIVYILKPAPLVINKYPNLDNVKDTIYKDRNGTCFKYDVNEVDCDKSEDKIKTYPLQ